LNMCVKNKLLVSWVIALSLVGMKFAMLLNQFTTTMITSNPFDGGKFTMKSTYTLSHGLSSVGNDHNNHVYLLLNF